MRITILGCGGSGGVPMVGGDWGKCDPAEPRNARTRCSILVEEAGRRLLVDTSPDLRAQMLAAKVDGLEAVLWTHSHADHLNGIDDLRAINRLINRPLPVYGPPETIAHVQRSFAYVFEPLPDGVQNFYKPVLVPSVIEPGDHLQIAGMDILALEQDHGFSRSYAYRFGRFAYSTDVVRMSEETLTALEGIDVWIVDAFRHAPHTTHSHVAQTLGWIERLKPKRAILTHMTDDMDYRSLLSELPSGVEPAYDGMVIEVQP
ncbi:MBL fold metallo-hydrolase [Lacibacterium aquatile]|uniref:MBL fold metallo-hydrolase n=1 Tax=Lacibacterium aquatile TaxID=1168082 RepID=A0ABW5DP92_9PROT